jgi:phosphoglycolate phosphatase-like HAD superfamily hydrolase|tara:strand:+ start:23855 stop:24289 length:435 start_codon:yes stop_codon:yes gene_type:complete
MDIIFDIDGTLMDISHRKKFVESKPKDWNSFRDETPNDTPIKEVFLTAIALQKAGHNIIIASGRNKSQRAITMKQLIGEGLVFIDLFMRSDKDFRSDVVLKKEMLGAMRRKGYNPKMVFDDRSSVVQMWRDEGLRVAQVAPGDF